MIADGSEDTVTLRVVREHELAKFKLDLQESFGVAAQAAFGQSLDEPIPADEDIEESIAAPGSIVYSVLLRDERVGGAIVLIDEVRQHNSLAFFFISTNQHSRGIGHRAWQAIERAHPRTKVWETVTPYFEKRNIHFYVNKCAFKIVEFYNTFNPDPHQKSQVGLTDNEDDEMFRLQKIMDLSPGDLDK